MFRVRVNTDAIHQVTVVLLANEGQETRPAKTRTEVGGGEIEPWKQKGTGRTRQGSIRAPQWIKGGIIFTPKPRDYRMSVLESMRGVAVKSALTSKVQDGQMVVLETLAFEAPKTRKMVGVLKTFDARKTLIITGKSDEVLCKSARNTADVQVMPVNNINVYDLLKFEKLVITKNAISKIEGVYA